jgi:hypothetical protein
MAEKQECMAEESMTDYNNGLPQSRSFCSNFDDLWPLPPALQLLMEPPPSQPLPRTEIRHARVGREHFAIDFAARAQSTSLPKMKAYFSIDNRAASLACERRLICLAAIVLALFFGGCASDTAATKSPVDGSDYPGWTKAASLPFTLMSHQSTF